MEKTEDRPSGEAKEPAMTPWREDVERLVHEYQDLFEVVPCYITVQDRNYRLIRYNREFSENFDAKLGEHSPIADGHLEVILPKGGRIYKKQGRELMSLQ